jgi:hypothetical protein
MNADQNQKDKDSQILKDILTKYCREGDDGTKLLYANWHNQNDKFREANIPLDDFIGSILEAAQP